jgi:hypothetical protein
VTAVATGAVDIAAAPVLDVSLIYSSEIAGLTYANVSVLTAAKESEVAESYRSATYSILEILGLE